MATRLPLPAGWRPRGRADDLGSRAAWPHRKHSPTAAADRPGAAPVCRAKDAASGSRPAWLRHSSTRSRRFGRWRAWSALRSLPTSVDSNHRGEGGGRANLLAAGGGAVDTVAPKADLDAVGVLVRDRYVGCLPGEQRAKAWIREPGDAAVLGLVQARVADGIHRVWSVRVDLRAERGRRGGAGRRVRGVAMATAARRRSSRRSPG
jgi:hypothetical protein